MIVPMKKISVVVLEKERREALKVLRKVGVVHVEELKGESEELSTFKQKNSQVELAVSLLSEVKLPKNIKTDSSLSKEESISLAQKILSLTEEKKDLFSLISSNSSELERFSKWGNVNPEDFEYLAEKNVFLSMYEIPSDKYNLLSDEAKTILVDKDKSQARFLLISDHKLEQNENVPALPPEAYRIVMPRVSTAVLKQDNENAKKRLIQIEKEINDSAKFLPSLKKASENVLKDIEFENLYSGMGIEDSSASVKLAWLTGYVPLEDLEKVQKTAKENKWALASCDPRDDDEVPTKLKNSVKRNAQKRRRELTRRH